MMRVLIAFLLLPCTVFATITVTNRGASGDNTAGTTIVVGGRSGTLAAGSTGILVLASDNANAATNNIASTSYTDSKGNVWYVRGQGTGLTGTNAGTDLTVFTALITTPLLTTDTLTITFSVSTTAKAWSFIEAAPSAGNIVIDEGANITVSTSTTTLSAALTEKVPSTNDLVIGMGSSESADLFTPDDTDTTNGSWTASQRAAIGSGITGISVLTQTKVVTGYGSQTFDVTISATNDMRAGAITLTEVDAKTRAMGGGATSGNNIVATVGLPLAAGSAGVLWFAADNQFTGGAAGNFPSSISDSKSNTWTRQQNFVQDPSSIGLGVECAIYTSILTSALVGGVDTITCTFTTANVASRVFGLWEFAPSGAGPMTYVTGAGPSSTTSNTASPTITTSSIASGDYVVGVAGAEGPSSTSDGFVQDSGTTNGTWKKAQIAGRGTAGAAAMSGVSQWKLTTATATQVYNPTLGSSLDTIIGWVQIHDASSVGPTAQQKGAFFMLFP